MKVNEKIAELRTLHGMSQKELAERVFVSRSLVAKWEDGSRFPDRAAVARMAELFGVPLESIVETDKNALLEISGCIPGDAVIKPDEVRQTLDVFLEGLREKDRNVFLRRYVFFEKPDEIAARYGLSAGNVRIILWRLRGRLKQGLNRMAEEREKEKKE